MSDKEQKKKKYRKRRHKYPGQSTVTYHKEISHSKDKYFTMDIYKNNFAMKRLSGSAYKMYVYLSEHLDGDTFLISAALFSEVTGVSARSYQTTKQELLDNKYLVLRDDGNFDFYNHPYRQHTTTVYDKMGVPDPKTITNENDSSN